MMPARPAAVRCLSSTVMYLARAAALGAAVVVCLASTATAFISGGSMSLRTSVPFVGRTYVSSPMQRQLQRATHVPRRRLGINSLRATSDQEEEQSGFVNPYTAFRKWQLELVDSKAKGNDKYPEAVAGLMKEPGMTPEKAERLAKLSVSDPILYAIERRKEANEINNTPMDYRKIDGWFPMEWIMAGDFGWGFNKKKQRLADEKAKRDEEEG